MRFLAFMGGFPSVSSLSFPLPHFLTLIATLCLPSCCTTIQAYLDAHMQTHKLWIELLAALFLLGHVCNLIPMVASLFPSVFPSQGSFLNTFLFWHQAAEFQLQFCCVTLNKVPKPSQLLFPWTHQSPSGIKDMGL